LGSKKLIAKINQVEFGCCPGYRGIEPTEIFNIHHILSYKTLINKYIIPLPSLCLMACYGISKLNLQRIIKFIIFYTVKLLFLRTFFAVIFQNRIKKVSCFPRLTLMQLQHELCQVILLLQTHDWHNL